MYFLDNLLSNNMYVCRDFELRKVIEVKVKHALSFRFHHVAKTHMNITEMISRLAAAQEKVSIRV